MSANSQDNPLRAEKRKKLHALKAKGIEIFPHTYERTALTGQIHKDYGNLANGEKKPESMFKMAGRLMTLRVMGKASFFNIQDGQGALQIYLRTEELTPDDLFAFEHVDLGDFVGIEGFPFRSQKGELSLHARSFKILTKTIEPLPEKFHGIQDIEIKYRHRHLDLIADADSRQVFVTRSNIIKEIRRFLDDRGFMEVETPMLQPLYGGAAAHPFTTHHRALDMKLYLKISPELYLKRLVVGGFEKVYEINKNFRNESIDRSHNPEFTMLEFYEAYTDYEYQMKQFEDLICHLCMKIKGTLKFQYQGKDIDFTPPWRRLRVIDGVREYAGVDPGAASDKELFDACKANGSDLKTQPSRGEMFMELFELCAEKHLWNPTIVMDHPLEISPLSKGHRKDIGYVERFEPFAAYMEIGNSFTELNDPEEQSSRLKEQESKRGVDEEAHPMDEDFVLAIESGLPPTGGVGIGIERIVMILTDRPSIRDIIFFPTMKHK